MSVAASTQIKATDGVGVVSEAAEENFSYREISDLSEATEDNVPGEGKRQDELDDYERLMAGTQKSALHMHEEPEGSDSVGGRLHQRTGSASLVGLQSKHVTRHVRRRGLRAQAEG